MIRHNTEETKLHYELFARLDGSLVWRWEDGEYPKGTDVVIPGEVVRDCRLWCFPGQLLEVEVDVEICLIGEVPTDRVTPPDVDVALSMDRMMATVASRPLDEHLHTDMTTPEAGARWVRNWERTMWGYLRDLFIYKHACDKTGVMV